MADWLQTTKGMDGKRVAWVADGTEGYWAEIPGDMPGSDVIDDFVSDYDFGDDTSDDREARLRRRMRCTIYESFDPAA